MDQRDQGKFYAQQGGGYDRRGKVGAKVRGGCEGCGRSTWE